MELSKQTGTGRTLNGEEGKASTIHIQVPEECEFTKAPTWTWTAGHGSTALSQLEASFL